MAAQLNLRELKKQRTRNALLRSALELFTTQGFDRTTVDEIVEACEVSQRTFFRYFANKEEAAFAVQHMVEGRFVSALRERPAEESPFEALRHTVLGTWDALSRSVEEVIPVELHMRTYQMIESTPSLLAVHLRRSIELEEEIAHVIAEREGVDVDGDLRPRVAVAAFSGVMRLTGRLWGAGEDASVDSIRALTETYLDHLNPSLGERWRRDHT
ncbi:TetR family transcriptional regulator [Streptomyces sp. SID8379]|uniref:TetR/AcrR family transcriptional regulator n=1 Tax=unclassified Streptomyces TaxID=2593676 RepID=UPI0003A2970A|nr:MULTISPECIES: TetR family transcriptional regulator [unclassified Streptomyces]MYW65450.1 TetR family transcriptional regulator [Streptomyces sp. SID8379]